MKIEINIDGYLYPVNVVRANKRIFFQFRFNRKIMAEIKTMSGVQWHGFEDATHRELVLSLFKTDKIWSCADNGRNNFQLDYLCGKNPYARWDNIDLEINDPILRDHQKKLLAQGLQTHAALWAAEMGTGKTLAAIRLMEMSGSTDWWYVAPKSALRAVLLEFDKWRMPFRPKMLTYNGLVSEMKKDTATPLGVIFDESQKIKTPTSQRSIAAFALSEEIRNVYGEEGYVILMSGSPAPRSPVDWWHQCEVACPGFLKEGTPNKFKLRLGIHEQQNSLAGGTFLNRVSWLDDVNKCAQCGVLKEVHMSDHPWYPSENEVEKLYRRMKGLVTVVFKKDCLDLPDKQYREIILEPRPSVIRIAKLIERRSTRAIEALTLCRELSDGFQYVDEESGEVECNVCLGQKKTLDYKLKPEYISDTGLPPTDEDDFELSVDEYNEKYFEKVLIDCANCLGTGVMPKMVRGVEKIPTPKDDLLKELLDEHFDVGRLVVYAGFEASVNKCVEIALNQKWAVIKWDGKGIKLYDTDGTSLKVAKEETTSAAFNPLSVFQDDFENFPKVCFIGNAGAASTGLTLTASPSIFYYSNSFNADDRIQSEDRIHRMGMDVNRGATIIDVIHLPTDKYVLDNLKAKRKLQDISMGELSSIFKDV